MFFKNLLLYRLQEPYSLTADELNQQLLNQPFLPCPKSESFSAGWVSPYGLGHELYVHSLKGYMLFAYCKEEKLLPAAVVKEELDKKISEIEKREDRAIYRKERFELKEQIIINLRYQAFSRKKITFAYLDTQANWLVIDTSSRNKAEEVCSFLRKTLGSLKIALPVTNNSPQNIMTSWLVDKTSLSSFNIENNCDMLDPKQKTSMIKCKDQDLAAEEIIRHLHRGKQVAKLALNWDNKIAFEFSDDLIIRKIKFMDLIQQDRSEIKKQSPQEQLDTDFAIMTGEFSQFLPNLWSLFDGLAPITD